MATSKTPHLAGALEVRICPTREDALRVAHSACELLNRCDSDISAINAPFSKINPNATSKEKRMIETLAIQSLHPDFDFKLVNELWRGSDNGSIDNTQTRYCWQQFEVKVYKSDLTASAHIANG